MNERIRRIMEQAIISVDGQLFGKTYVPDEFTEKFAELIVEQCFRVALVEGKGYLDPVKLRNAMKQHFGVEE